MIDHLEMVILFVGLGVCGLAILFFSFQGKKTYSILNNLNSLNQKKLKIVKEVEDGSGEELTYKEAIFHLRNGVEPVELSKKSGVSLDELEALLKIIKKS